MNDKIIRGRKAHLYDLQQVVNGASLVYQTVVDLIALKQGDRLLDIGCGTGTVLRKLNVKYGSGIEFHGIDPSDDMIHLAQVQSELQTSNVHLQVASAQSLPFEDNSFDWVICTLTTHHLSDEIRESMYREIRRIIKPTGSIVISDFHYPKAMLGRAIVNTFMRRHAHISNLIQTPNESMLESAGFTLKRVEYQRPFKIVQHIVAEK